MPIDPPGSWGTEESETFEPIWGFLIAADSFLNYDFAVLVWAANSGHIIVALKANMILAFWMMIIMHLLLQKAHSTME